MSVEISKPNPDESSGAGRRIVQRSAALVGAVSLVAWLSTCLVFVDETEIVIVEKLGEVTAVLDRDEDRGLNMKAPWPIGNVRRFDRRIQLFDPAGREVFTRDRKNIIADAYVCWRIAEPKGGEELQDRPVLRFLRALGSPEMAQARLETRLRSTLATHVAQVELTSLMFVTDREAAPVEGEENSRKSLDEISGDLLASMRKRDDETESIRDQMGLEIVDLRIKRLSFPRGNQQAVFERMKSERRKIADRYRSAGLAENTKIRSKADLQHSEILATADAEAERIRGEAEATALAILNEAHAKDPDFYRLVKTLDSYETILNEKTTLVLSASSSLLKLLVDGIPENLPPRPPKTLKKTDEAKPVTSVGSESTGNEVKPASATSRDSSEAETGPSPDANEAAAARPSPALRAPSAPREEGTELGGDRV
ncbi:MAG: protease modulator HflC [Planctomycetaceae bacterium]|jgi:modulator of FtsH protease HflC|nr:protease modulator HflC [Planctomycetaceae bacterium]